MQLTVIDRELALEPGTSPLHRRKTTDQGSAIKKAGISVYAMDLFLLLKRLEHVLDSSKNSAANRETPPCTFCQTAIETLPSTTVFRRLPQCSEAFVHHLWMNWYSPHMRTNRIRLTTRNGAVVVQRFQTHAGYDLTELQPLPLRPDGFPSKTTCDWKHALR